MLIKDEEFEEVKGHLSQYSIFTQLLSEDWIKNVMLNQEERLQKHVLFWELLDDVKVKKLANELAILQQDNQIIPSVVSKIKQIKDPDNFDALRTELIVLAYYENRESSTFKVKYQPSVPDSANRNDILLIINGEPYYLEIFVTLDDKVERDNRRLQDMVKARIEKINQHSFLISFSLLVPFTEQDIDELITFLETKIAELSKTNEQKIELMFKDADSSKAEILLLRDNSKRSSSVGMIMSGVRELRTDGRLKNAILTKTEQFSPSNKNILITHLLHAPARFDDYYNGLIGQEAVRINKVTFESTPFRHQNGAIHDVRTNKIGAFICFERNDYTQRKKHLNPNANHTIDSSVLDIL